MKLNKDTVIGRKWTLDSADIGMSIYIENDSIMIMVYRIEQERSSVFNS